MKRKIPVTVLFLLFAALAIYSGYKVFVLGREYDEGEKVYEDLSQYIRVSQPAASVDEPKTENKAPEIANGQAALPGDSVPSSDEADALVPGPDAQQGSQTAVGTVWPEVDFEGLSAINPDIVGWIYIEGTPVNYPIVRGEDNSYYLDRLFDGSSNSSGSIFMDYRNAPDFSDRHTVIYGHHMRNDTMFACVAEYEDQAFYEAHPCCLIMTPSGNYKIEFFAGYSTDPNDDSWKLQFGSDQEYTDWLEQGMSVSDFKSDVMPTAQDRVVTLSTCIYDYNEARYVLLGVLR